jgi:hypothetical protein
VRTELEQSAPPPALSARSKVGECAERWRSENETAKGRNKKWVTWVLQRDIADRDLVTAFKNQALPRQSPFNYSRFIGTRKIMYVCSSAALHSTEFYCRDIQDTETKPSVDPGDQWVRLQSLDGFCYLVKRKVANASGTIRNMLDSDGTRY